jgi:hypothetical protein
VNRKQLRRVTGALVVGFGGVLRIGYKPCGLGEFKSGSPSLVLLFRRCGGGYTKLVNYMTRESFSPFSQEAPLRRQGGTVRENSLWRVTTEARERWRIVNVAG